MKKKYLTVAVASTLALSMLSTSCIGSYTMTNNLLSWNLNVGNKFVNEVVFFAFWILPVYEIAVLADTIVLNSIEFWSGNNPLTASTSRVIDGQSGRYLVCQDPEGYTIKNLDDKNAAEVRLNFNADDNAWDIIDPATGEAVRMMTFVDDNHIAVPSPDGSDMIVELSHAGAFAYQQAVVAAASGSRID